jgi:putative spermidine/putrescine transport system permease protein
VSRSELAGWTAAFVVAAPVLIGLGYSVLGSIGLAGAGASGEADLQRLLSVLARESVWRGTAWSIWIAASSTLISAAGAIILAIFFRSSATLDRVARGVAILPLPVPHVVAGVMGVLILGQSGLLARVAHSAGFIDTPAEMPALVFDSWGTGLILTLVWKEIPFLSLIAFSVLASNGESFEETARTLGANRFQTLRRVTLPLLVRGILPAAVAVFAFAAGSYELALLLAPSDPLALPLQTMERYTDSSLARRGEAFVLALLALMISAAAVALHEAVRDPEPVGRQ